MSFYEINPSQETFPDELGFSEITPPIGTRSGSDANDIERLFLNKFEEFSQKIALEKDSTKVRKKGWDDLESKLETYLCSKFSEFFGQDVIDEIGGLVQETDDSAENKADFENKLSILIHERDAFQQAISLGCDPPSRTSSPKKVDDQKVVETKNDDVEMRMLKDYGLDISELDKQNALFEKAVTEIIKKMKEKHQELSKDISVLDEIRGWVKKAPSFLRRDADTLSIEEMIMLQLNEHMDSMKIHDRLEEYKQIKLDFLSLISRCDRFFTKKRKCNVCFTEDITHVLIPCGHCFCQSCCGRLQRNRCHICRQNVSQKYKIHLP